MNNDGRKSPRVYDLKPTVVDINGTSYQLHDLSRDGCAIIVDSPHTFLLGQRLHPIVLQSKNRHQTLSGVVAHISKTKTFHICGIRFLFLNIDEYNFITQFKMERIPTPDA